VPLIYRLNEIQVTADGKRITLNPGRWQRIFWVDKEDNSAGIKSDLEKPSPSFLRRMSPAKETDLDEQPACEAAGKIFVQPVPGQRPCFRLQFPCWLSRLALIRAC
jgi:hypothetical protein